MAYKNILFDLDGTLTDPGTGITNSVAYALEKYGIINTDRTELYKFIGPPLKSSFMEYYGFSEADAEQAVVYYRERFRDGGGMFENVVYEGTGDMLKTLKAAGCRVIMATSKPEEFAVKILEHFDLLKYFDIAAGASFDSSRSEKADVITYALKLAGIEDKAETIMVGDRKHDIIGAAANGLAAIGVLYGYGDRAELEGAGATFIAATPAEVAEICLK